MNETPVASGSGFYWILRILAAAVALLFAALALRMRSWITICPAAATVAIICCWFALCGHISESRARIALTLSGALILSVISFLGGVVAAPFRVSTLA